MRAPRPARPYPVVQGRISPIEIEVAELPNVSLGEDGVTTRDGRVYLTFHSEPPAEIVAGIKKRQ